VTCSLTGFIGCCGADVFTGFGIDPQTTASYELTADRRSYAKDANGKLVPAKTFEQKFHEQLQARRKTYANGGRMYCCILNETQYSSYNNAWAKILKKAGFEFVRRWCNANHNDVEFLYLFVLCDDFKGSCKGDHKVPPKGWDDLEGPPEKETLFGKLKEVLVQPAAT
jgi:hypothetical protein